MLRFLVFLFAYWITCGVLIAQTCINCNSNLFATQFLNLRLKPVERGAFHYVRENEYKPLLGIEKRTEEYKYIHNGDNYKGTIDILTDNVQGSGWLKNFDFGKFANLVIEVRGDRSEGRGGVFDWSGNLIFFKIFKKRQFGWHK